MSWLRKNWLIIVAALTTVVLIVGGIWFWGILVGYIEPKDATGRKDVVQIFALIVAGVVGAIGAIVGIANVAISRRNLQQQLDLEEGRRETALALEDKRTQDAALQAYFEQMGALLTNHNLISTAREDIRLLARAQTLTVLGRLDGHRKGDLVRFLHGAGLIKLHEPVVELEGVDLSEANLNGADLRKANLSGAELFVTELRRADLSMADLRESTVTSEQLATCRDLTGATMRDGQKYEDWLKTDKQNGSP